jgi:uncharacterized protein YqeY
MSIRERLAHDLRQALRDRDAARKLTIRLLLAAITNEEKSGESHRELTEDEIVSVVSRQAKQRRESIAIYKEAGRQDLAEEDELQLNIMLEYLPKQMTREEILESARQAIKQVGATGPKQMGEVMRHLMPALKGRADGREANQIVRDLLAGNPQA